MDVLYSKDAENRLLSLACTAVAITIDDTMTMYVFFHQLRHSIVLITGNKICSQEYPDPTPQKLQHMNKFTLRWLTLQYVLASWFITTCQRCQAWENVRGKSRNSGCQVWTYEMSEGTLASAYVLCPFQALVPRFWRNRGWRMEVRSELFSE